ncbi:hypothetical protein QCD60_22380 [Pokkaliibacter sp. MBI-7]|uniref:hypothetical protein n=1 Tax=Pokkaliibacter sp. MBI-7 TaxID=3040600 RepID=UPI0024480AC2|nr:hypothetical protein [Pokkaliibacter sp. MBI-7]MDH2435275.1 hypothetical protein [Pokkaliibacter sp. MBI-7]
MQFGVNDIKLTLKKLKKHNDNSFLLELTYGATSINSEAVLNFGIVPYIIYEESLQKILLTNAEGAKKLSQLIFRANRNEQLKTPVTIGEFA